MNGIGITGGGDVRITHSYVHDNGYNGIEVTGKWGTKSVHNIYIGHCVAENNAGNPAILDNHSGSGILVGHVTNATIEYCEAMGEWVGYAEAREWTGWNLGIRIRSFDYSILFLA